MEEIRKESRRKYLDERAKKVLDSQKADLDFRISLKEKGVLSELEAKEVELDQKLVQISRQIIEEKGPLLQETIKKAEQGSNIDESMKEANKIYQYQEKYGRGIKKDDNWEQMQLKNAISGDDTAFFTPIAPKKQVFVKKRADFSSVQQSLPVYQYKKTLLEAVDKYPVLVVVGDTGSGKSTQIPQYLLERSNNESIVCTQPRRVAAMSVAARVAQERNCELGFEVGYSVRFDDKTSQYTKIRYMTDGTLLREFLLDPLLSKYTVIMIDEAHERSVSTDILLSLLKDLVVVRPEFRVIIASATLDAEKISLFYDKAPILHVPGRRFEVDIKYSTQPIADFENSCVATALEIHKSTPVEQPCDILVFLTGQEEIEKAVEKINIAVKGSGLPPIEALPIYAALPSEKQSKVFAPTPIGTRKIVFATNIAETSITIDTVKYVIDCGYNKEASYNPKSGCSSLDIKPISVSSADQRAGRAGRTSSGICYRLYTQLQYENEMNKTSKPELQRSDFAPTLLLLLSMGIDSIVDFVFMDPPPVANVMAAYELLFSLRAINSESKITQLGMQMAQFPVSPQSAKCIIESWKLGCQNGMITILSILESGSPLFYQPYREGLNDEELSFKFFWDDYGDHITALNVYNAWVESDYSIEWCHANHIQGRTLNAARSIRNQLFDISTFQNLESPDELDDTNVNISRAFAYGFFLNSAQLGNNGLYQTIKGLNEVEIHPSSCLTGTRHPRFCIFHQLVMTSKKFMKTVIKVEPKWIKDAAPNLFDYTDGEIPKLSYKK